MVKKAILFLSAALSISGVGMAQTQTLRCYADEMQARLKEQFPEIARYEEQLEREIQQKLQAMDLRQFAKTTADDTVYHVPLVFHVIHNYGDEYVTDNAIYQTVEGINKMYNKGNADTSDVIQQYRGKIPGTDVPYIGNARIRFHLATKDPQGNPTNGITRRRSYLTGNAGDQAKFDLWPPSSYINIWIVQKFNSQQSEAAAYAYKPASAAANPYGDGVISLFNYMNADNTISHELGHVLNLDHPWGSTNNCEVDCGDDGVDDTPPTHGHCPNHRCGSEVARYDTDCVYTKVGFGRPSIAASTLPRPSTSSIWGIEFVARQALTIDSLRIYPTDTIGAPFTILLRHYGDVVDSFAGVVTTNTGYQSVPVDFSVAADSGYLIVFRRNPGALRDSVGVTYPKSINNVIELKNDNTAQFYNFFYNWSISYGASSTGIIGKPSINLSADRANHRGVTFKTFTGVIIDSVDIYPTDTLGAPFTIVIRDVNAPNTVRASYSGTTTERFNRQRVPVAFDVPGRKDAYEMVFAVNPAAMRDSSGVVYNRQVPYAFDMISEKAADGKYNYFYNWQVRYGYFKVYTRQNTSVVDPITGSPTDSLVNYPDTTNSQNVMDYTYCSKMFTHGQTERMRAALTSSVAGRNNLFSKANLEATGALSTKRDLPPVADFSVTKTLVTPGDRLSVDKVFGCADGNSRFGFVDRSWNDTIVSRSWSFSNGSSSSGASTASVTNVTFTQPGWVNVTLTVTGNNTGSSTVTRPAVYVADPNAVKGLGYFQEFNPDGDVDKWPMFNYFENSHKWEVVSNIGYYDKFAIRYNNYDDRITFPSYLTGTPQGDYDDFFSPVFDLSGPEYATNCNLNFMSAGAFRTTDPSEMNDSLEIYYSTNCGDSWSLVRAPLTKTEIGNNGTQTISYAPTWMGEWQLQSIPLPEAAKSPKTVFRFRYKPGVFANTLIGSGNNFYMDRIHISQFPTGVDGTMLEKQGIVLTPNPTHGGAKLMVNNGQTGVAQVQVTDVTGKLVFQMEHQMTPGLNTIEIPASYITAKGMYMVQLVSGNKTYTEKLVVY
jgi:hypothetical protein